MAIFGSSALSAFIAAGAGLRVNRATARKVSAEAAKIEHGEAAEVEKVVNERVKIILDANAQHIAFLTGRIEALTTRIEELTGELHAARAEIALLRGERRPAARDARPESDFTQNF